MTLSHLFDSFLVESEWFRLQMIAWLHCLPLGLLVHQRLCAIKQELPFMFEERVFCHGSDFELFYSTCVLPLAYPTNCVKWRKCVYKVRLYRVPSVFIIEFSFLKRSFKAANSVVSDLTKKRSDNNKIPAADSHVWYKMVFGPIAGGKHSCEQVELWLIFSTSTHFNSEHQRR